MKDFTKSAFQIEKCCKPHRYQGNDYFAPRGATDNNEISKMKCCKNKFFSSDEKRMRKIEKTR